MKISKWLSRNYIYCLDAFWLIPMTDLHIFENKKKHFIFLPFFPSAHLRRREISTLSYCASLGSSSPATRLGRTRHSSSGSCLQPLFSSVLSSCKLWCHPGITWRLMLLLEIMWCLCKYMYIYPYFMLCGAYKAL